MLSSTSFFHRFYDQLLRAIPPFDAQFNAKKVVIDVTPIHHGSGKKHNDISFLDHDIQLYIDTHYSYFHTFVHTFVHPSHRKVILHVADSLGTLSPRLEKEAIEILRIILLLQTLFGKQLPQVVYYYPTPFKKTFPKKSPSPSSLTPKEVNSGVTFLEAPNHQSHQNGEIILFRREEHLKVLIHELIHSFHLDYQIILHSKAMERSVCSNYPVLLNEAYTEAFATMIRLFFHYYTKYHKSKIGLDQKKLIQIIRAEVKYELGLARKVLEFNGLRPADLPLLVRTEGEGGECLERFQQMTNVFSYYILKPLLLYNLDVFFDRFMREYTRGGLCTSEGTQILQNFVIGQLRLDPRESGFVRALARAPAHKGNSLKMVNV